MSLSFNDTTGLSCQVPVPPIPSQPNMTLYSLVMPQYSELRVGYTGACAIGKNGTICGRDVTDMPGPWCDKDVKVFDKSACHEPSSQDCTTDITVCYRKIEARLQCLSYLANPNVIQDESRSAGSHSALLNGLHQRNKILSVSSQLSKTMSTQRKLRELIIGSLTSTILFFIGIIIMSLHPDPPQNSSKDSASRINQHFLAEYLHFLGYLLTYVALMMLIITLGVQDHATVTFLNAINLQGPGTIVTEMYDSLYSPQLVLVYFLVVIWALVAAPRMVRHANEERKQQEAERFSEEKI